VRRACRATAPPGRARRWLAVRDQWLTPRRLLLALAIAALGHGAEVGHTVFKRW